MKLNVWKSSLPEGQSFNTTPPVPGAVRDGEINVADDDLPYVIPLWTIEVETVAELVAIIEAAGGSAELTTRDPEYPHPELVLP